MTDRTRCAWCGKRITQRQVAIHRFYGSYHSQGCAGRAPRDRLTKHHRRYDRDRRTGREFE